MARFDPQIDALNLTPSLAPGGVDRNPCTMPEQTLYRDNFTLAPINAKELALFQAQFSEILMMQGSDERKVMLGRVPQYVIAMRAVKQALAGPAFAGIYAEDTELGMGYIRPQFTRGQGTVALPHYNTTWAQPLTIAWADWFFETATNPFAVGKDFGLCITHIKSLLSPAPIVAEVRFNVGRTQLLPVDTRNIVLADTENDIAIIPVPTMILVPKASFYARARSDVAGTDQIPLGGLVFGLGRVLREEIPTWTA